jgi:N6-adenosine-specific RNA methylase IME4
MTELARYEAAERALAAAEAVDEVLEIRSQAEAWRAYAKQAKNRDLEIKAARIRFRAEKRLGEMLIAAKDLGQIRPGNPHVNRSESEQLKDGDALAQAEADLAAFREDFEARPLRVTLQEAGIDRKLSARAQKLAGMDAAAFEHALSRYQDEMQSGAGRVAMDLLKIDAEERGRVHRRNLAQVLSEASAQRPSGRLYPALSADPPWQRKAGIGNRAYENHYPTMTWPAILDYLTRAGEALLPDAWAWMWIPRAHLLAEVEFEREVTVVATGECVLAREKLPLAYACQLALGMDAYSTCYVWTKTDAEHPDVSGSGLLAWDQDELLLQFKRGRGLPKPAGDEKFGSNHRERPREHSRKPDFYRHMIATMVGADDDGVPLPVLELFARVDAEHPLPPRWDAWGNQAGVALVAPDDAAAAASDAPSPEDLRQAFVAARAARDAERLFEHPAIAEHVISMTRDYPGGVSFNVATCRCGWSFRVETKPFDLERDDAVDAHWRDIITKSSLPAPSGETEAAAAEATSQGASAAAAVEGSSQAPYDAADAAVVDQLAEAPIEPAPLELELVDPAEIEEREALKILSDFCHVRRPALAAALGEFYRVRGYSYLCEGQWALLGKGWDRLRELEALESVPRAELTEPYRAPQLALDLSAALGIPAPVVVDGALQTRLPTDEDEAAERAALLAVAEGRSADVESGTLRSLVGRGLAHATLSKGMIITAEGRAFLAQVAPIVSREMRGGAS